MPLQNVDQLLGVWPFLFSFSLKCYKNSARKKRIFALTMSKALWIGDTVHSKTFFFLASFSGRSTGSCTRDSERKPVPALKVLESFRENQDIKHQLYSTEESTRRRNDLEAPVGGS